MAGFSVEAARTTYAIPEGFEPVAAIALGYSAEEAPASRTRRPQDELVFHGQWETPY
jgi:nitroreductase